jgi:glycosyl-4,4'-diaponeurosporenoate acyltransferase
VLVPVSWWLAVALDALAWAGWSAAVGWYQASRPVAALTPGPLTRLRPGEIGGRPYRRWLHIDGWKDSLPEAGSWFGGLSKRHLPTPSEGGLDRFAAECVRAERTHGAILALLPVLVVWNPAGLVVANAAFAVVANVPCLLVARYNRARIAGLRARRRPQPS